MPFLDRKKVVNIIILLEVAVAALNSQTNHRVTSHTFVWPWFDIASSLFIREELFASRVTSWADTNRTIGGV